jgi:hypothetical protein
MGAAKSNTATTPEVPEEIEQRLAALTPEQFVTPPQDETGAHFVCPATDRIKRLFTLRSHLANECLAIGISMRNVAKETVAAIAAKNPSSVLQELTADNDLYKAGETKFQQLNLELKEKFSLAVLINKTLWPEVRRQHPDLKDKSLIGVYGDWSIGWREESDF